MKNLMLILAVIFLVGCQLPTEQETSPPTNKAVIMGEANIVYNSGHPVLEKACLDIIEIRQSDNWVTKELLTNNAKYSCKGSFMVYVPLNLTDKWRRYYQHRVIVNLDYVDHSYWKVTKLELLLQ